MDAKSMADAMFPFWMLGLTVLYLTMITCNEDLLKVDKKGLLSFGKFLLTITAIRLFYMEFLAPQEVMQNIKHISNFLPLAPMLGVWWEDACNAMAFVLIDRMLSENKWFQRLKILLLSAMSISFGLSHAYQGWWAVVVMTCYMPVTIRLGKKYGFGTVMICHIVYDIITMISFRLILGL